MKNKSILDPNEKGTIAVGHYHPAADSAMRYVKSIPFPNLIRYQEAFASTALSGNELSEILSETLRRLLEGDPVSDRYLLGLAWMIKEMEESHCAKG